MPPLIDGHTHVFNVGFLPVEGIMRAHGVPTFIAHAVTLFLEKELERELPAAGALAAATPRESLHAMLASELSARTQRPDAVALDEPDLIARVVRLVPARDLEELRPVLVESEVEISPASRAITDARTPAAAVRDPYEEDRRRLDSILREAARHAGPIESEGGEPEGEELLGLSVGGLIEWLLLLVQHESRIVKSFPAAWNPSKEFALTVHHMMDMAPHYVKGRKPVYDFVTEQIPRMRAVVAQASVPLIGFVAYSPKRAGWEAVIDDALKGGFVGVKFYPPNGYRPIGNTDKTLDAENLKLFRRCGAEVPIFSHCTSTGVEAGKDFGKFSDPANWRMVLDTPGLSGLRLCLGHAGGQDGWLAPLNAAGEEVWKNSYAKVVVELCTRPDSNVYCDFGFFDKILDGGGAELFGARLAAVVNGPNGRIFAQRCCYGTDWHLVSRQTHAAQYPDIFAQLLRNSGLDAYAPDILGLNVLRFLNLPAFLKRSWATLGNEERNRIQALATLT